MTSSALASGKHVLMTGGTHGIGYFAAEQCAAAGNRVTIAARTKDKFDAARRAIEYRTPGAQVDFVELDLSSLSSVQTAAAQILAGDPVDVLIANAGVVHSPGTEVTAEGIELYFGTNHLGHFALASALFSSLAERPCSRLVSA